MPRSEDRKTGRQEQKQKLKLNCGRIPWGNKENAWPGYTHVGTVILCGTEMPNPTAVISQHSRKEENSKHADTGD